MLPQCLSTLSTLLMDLKKKNCFSGKHGMLYCTFICINLLSEKFYISDFIFITLIGDVEYLVLIVDHYFSSSISHLCHTLHIPILIFCICLTDKINCVCVCGCVRRQRKRKWQRQGQRLEGSETAQENLSTMYFVMLSRPR